MTQQATQESLLEPTSGLSLRLFGRFECVVHSEPLTLPTRKAAAILAVLSLEGSVSRSRLANLLWPEFDEDTSRKNLRQELHRLSKTPVKAFLELLSAEVRLVSAASDVLQFRALAGTDPALALEVYAAPFLEGFDERALPEFEAWMLEQRESLEAIRRGLLVELAGRLERAGNVRGALERVLELIGLDGLQERFYRDAMRLHAALGEREAALRLFEVCRRVLHEDLGLEPLPETVQLAESLRGSDAQPASRDVLRAPNAFEVPFVGRDQVLERLELGWQKHLVIVVMGEPGSGKSRLLREFLADKGPVLTMHGRPEDQGIAYATISRCLREWLTFPSVQLEPWVRTELARLLPELAGEKPEPNGEASQLRLFDAASEVMRQAMTGKVALFGDDSQFVDTWSAELTRYALGRITALNPAHRTVSAFRKEHMDEVQLRLLADLERNDVATLIALEPLSVTDVGQLVGRLSGRPATVFPQRLHEVTGGNPFFLVETLRGLFERGDVRVQGDVWVTAFDETTSDYRELPIQPTVRAAVLERVDRLGSAARRVLEVGALAGEQHFSLGAASQATALGEFEVLEALEAAIAARLIEAQANGYKFSHDLVARSLQEALSPDRARLIHRRLAAHLETVGAQAARVAEHFERGGAHLEAARAWAKAARESHGVFAFPDALDCYDRSLGHWQAASGHLHERLELMVGRFWLARQVGRANDPSLVESMLELASTPLERGNALFAKAVLLGDANEHRLGLDVARRAFEQFMEAQDFNAAFYALTVCGARARALGEFDVALDLAAQALDVGRMVGPLNVVDAYQEQAAAFEESGDPAAALESALLALREYENAMASGVRESSGHWLLGARVHDGLAIHLNGLGRHVEALEHANIAVSEAQARNIPRRELGFLLNRADVLKKLGRCAEALADLQRALPMAQHLQVLEQEVQTRLESLMAH